MPSEKAGGTEDSPKPDADTKIQDMSYQDCLDLSAYHFERWVWETGDQEDLNLAALLQWLALSKSTAGGYFSPRTSTPRDLLHAWETTLPSMIEEFFNDK